MIRAMLRLLELAAFTCCSVAVGFATVMFLDGVLPRSKSLGPIILLAGLASGALCGVVLLRLANNARIHDEKISRR